MKIVQVHTKKGFPVSLVGIGYPLQCSWASLVAQLVKNLPAMWETWVQSLGWENSLEKGKATHSVILAWRIPWTVHGVTKSQTRLSDFHFHTHTQRSIYILSPQLWLGHILGSKLEKVWIAFVVIHHCQLFISCQYTYGSDSLETERIPLIGKHEAGGRGRNWGNDKV